MTKKKSVSELFNKLAKAENDFKETSFMSPVIKHQPIRVRVAGVIISLQPQPRTYEGWGIFQLTSNTAAKFLREATLQEKQRYLSLFPTLRFIITRRLNNFWYGIPARSSDTRFKIQGQVPIQLSEEIQLFDTVQTRYDGFQCFFESLDFKANLKTSMLLREALNTLVEPKNITIIGITQQELDAYTLAYLPALEADMESKRDKNEDRLKDALLHAGANYKGYVERGDTYTIEYSVDGETHKSVVDKNTLQVHSAGICISNQDSRFDLHSLVGVIREGINHHRIHRVSLRDTPVVDYEDDDA